MTQDQGPFPAPNLLTIAIPTFNRSHHLERLLTHLSHEVNLLGDSVCVLVSDNASDDDTETIVANATKVMNNLTFKRQPRNVGADENFCSLVDAVTTDYFWLIGDDDLPRHGTLERLVDLLIQERPDTVYLEPLGTAEYLPHHLASRVDLLDCDFLGRREMVRRTHVFTTFVSSWVINKETCSQFATRRFAGTHLVQLGWVLGAIAVGRKHIYVTTPAIYGLMGNSGGYAALEVFITNFAQVVRTAFRTGSPSQTVLAEEIISRSAHRHLPWLLQSIRQNTAGDFSPAMSPNDLRARDAGGHLWAQLLRVIMTAPAPVASAAFYAARRLAGLGRVRDRLLELLPGRRRRFHVP